MRIKPDLADDIIAAQLEIHYKIAPRSLEFLPIGNDARAWAYRVASERGDYFLKLRQGPLNLASLAVPRYLQSNGIPNAVAPILNNSGQLFSPCAGFALILFPFIEGESAWEMPLTADQWRCWGEIMRAIHKAEISAQLAALAPREVFAVKWLDELEQVEAALATGDYHGEYAEALAALWRQHAHEVETARRRYLSLGAQLAARSPQFLLCHADIHTANIIIDGAGMIHIVDWDETIIAPKERDLMFFIGDGRPSQTAESFLEGYGPCEIDRLGLAYYKYDWVIQELADYGGRLLLSPDLDPTELAFALDEFKDLFAPGDVVERAHRAYADLGAYST